MEAKAFGLKQEKERKNMWDILWLNCVMTRCLQNVISLGVNVLKKFWVLSNHLVGSISIILSRGFPKSGPMAQWSGHDFQQIFVFLIGLKTNLNSSLSFG